MCQAQKPYPERQRQVRDGAWLREDTADVSPLGGFFCYFDPFKKLFSIVNRSKNYFPIPRMIRQLCWRWVLLQTRQDNWRGCPVVECPPGMLTDSRFDVAFCSRANCPGADRLPRNRSMSRFPFGCGPGFHNVRAGAVGAELAKL